MFILTGITGTINRPTKHTFGRTRAKSRDGNVKTEAIKQIAVPQHDSINMSLYLYFFCTYAPANIEENTPTMTVTNPMIVISAVSKPKGVKIADRIEPNEIKLPSTKQKEIISKTKFLSFTAARKADTKSFSLGS